MSIVINNTDDQLNITINGVLDVYAVQSIKSIGRAIDASGDYYISINFIANDKNNPLRIYLKDVISPVSWTNDFNGANAALSDLRNWLSQSISISINEATDSILVYGYDSVGGNNEPISVDGNGQVNTNLHDGSGNAITSTTIGGQQAVDVNIAGGVTLEVNLDAADDEVSIYGSDGGNPTAVAVDSSGAVAIQDGGNSITVDGSVAATQSGSWSVTNLANSGVDIGDVTINNAAGAAAVNIQDGGNVISIDDAGGSLTVDAIQLPASVGKKPNNASLSVTLANNELGIARTPGMIRPNNVSGNVNSVAATFYSVSVANVGTASGLVLGQTIKAGEILNFSADAINNYFSSFAYDATGTEFVIIYVS